MSQQYLAYADDIVVSIITQYILNEQLRLMQFETNIEGLQIILTKLNL